MIPTSYTNATFGDYLMNEVLRGTANELGWLDIAGSPAVRQGLALASATTNGATTLSTGKLPRYIPAGTTLDFGTFTKVSGSAQQQGAGSIGITVPMGATIIPVFTKFTAIITPEVARVRNPFYDSITTETVMRMGLNDITEVIDIRRLRLYGRREAWKKVMQALVAGYDYATQSGGGSRSQAYEQAAAMLAIEDERIQRLYPETVATPILLAPGSDTIYRSKKMKTNVSW